MKKFVIILILSFISGIIITMGTTSRASSDTVNLHLTGMYACENLRIFRVRHTAGDFAVDYQLDGRGYEVVSGSIGPGEEQFVSIDVGSTSGGVTAILRWNNGVQNKQSTKQSNNNQTSPENCPGYVPPEPEPEVIEPVPEVVQPELEISEPVVDVQPEPVFTDGRCNMDTYAPAVVYTTGDGLEVYGIYADTSEGYLLFTITWEAVEALNLPQDESVLVESATSIYGGMVQLWRDADGGFSIIANELPPEGHKIYNSSLVSCAG